MSGGTGETGGTGGTRGAGEMGAEEVALRKFSDRREQAGTCVVLTVLTVLRVLTVLVGESSMGAALYVFFISIS
jgi:hypothetical protein